MNDKNLVESAELTNALAEIRSKITTGSKTAQSSVLSDATRKVIAESFKELKEVLMGVGEKLDVKGKSLRVAMGNYQTSGNYFTHIWGAIIPTEVGRPSHVTPQLFVFRSDRVLKWGICASHAATADEAFMQAYKTAFDENASLIESLKPFGLFQKFSDENSRPGEHSNEKAYLIVHEIDLEKQIDGGWSNLLLADFKKIANFFIDVVSRCRKAGVLDAEENDDTSTSQATVQSKGLKLATASDLSSNDKVGADGKAKYWKISCGLGGRFSPDHKKYGIISVGWGDTIPDLTKYRNRDECLAFVLKTEATGFDKTYATKTCWTFAFDVKPGDFVLGYGSGAVLLIGVVEGKYEFAEVTAWTRGNSSSVDPSHRHIRHVKWLDTEPVETASLSLELKRKLERNQTMFDLTDDEAKEIFEKAGVSKTKTISVAEKFSEFAERISLDHLIEATGKPHEFFVSLERRLLEKKQAVLYGPPGTSKTHIARLFAQYFQEQFTTLESVQFHPSYSYEDFIEGYRPNGTGFEVQNGIFKDFCRKAQSNRQTKHVFLIDEVNRGNLAQIFGELLYLLEYRNEETILTYSKSRFSIPDNVYIIATMNSADRSIAMVDYALRRRFDFFELPADENVLISYLSKNNCKLPVQKVVSFFNKVNEVVSTELGRHYSVGHTYFMKRDMTEDTIADIWKYSVAPLLDEYFFNNERVRETITFDQLWQPLSDVSRAA